MITDAEKFECAKRELRLRKAAYPVWVERGIMLQATADMEIERMTAIVEDYQERTKGERLI